MFLAKRTLLLAKEEGTYGSDPTPVVASNAIEAMDIKVQYRGDVLERNLMRETLSPKAALMGKRYMELSFTCELKGSGTAGVAPRLGDLLEACGFTETVVASTSVTYSPASTAMKSCAFYVYELADTGSTILHKVFGARSNVKFSLSAGAIAKAEFTFQGIYTAMTDVAAPTAPTFEATKPAVVTSATFTSKSVSSLVVQNLEFDVGNDLTQSESINSASGISSINIVGRKPVGSMNPESVLVATYSLTADMIAGTESAMSVVVGATAGNICTITAPKVTFDSVSQGDRNGVRTYDIPFRCAMNTGNDELVVAFT